MAQNTKYKQLLANQGIDQKDVANKTGLTKSLVNLIANGYSNVTISTLKKLVIFHKCSPNDILDWEKWHEAKTKKGG